jgi:hypothetical protein
MGRAARPVWPERDFRAARGGWRDQSKTGRGVVAASVFLLVQQARLPKWLDFARGAERAHDAVPGLIVAKRV